jgi:hypothetical protein
MEIHVPIVKNSHPTYYTVTDTGPYGAAPTQGSKAHINGGPGGAGALETFTNNGNGSGTDTNNSTTVTGGIGNGGGGGYNTPAPGAGGAGGASGQGGAGYAYTKTTVATAATNFAYAAGTGGSSGEAGGPGDGGTPRVGPGDSGGAGGSGVASAYAKNASGQARAKATAWGGTGGGGYGAFQIAGAGGSAAIGKQSQTPGQPTVHQVNAVGKSAFATTYQYGGQGGGSDGGAGGGAGAASYLLNGVTGTATAGGLYLNQVANGGSGGYSSDGLGGVAGYGKSVLVFSDTATPSTGTTYAAGTTYVRGISSAVGGSGGSSGGAAGGNGAIGANATASATVTGPHAVIAQANAGSTDHGGAGGNANQVGGTGNGAAAGTVNAAATATSNTTAGDNVTATTTVFAANGGSSGANGGTANGGAGGAVTGATATATQTNPTIGGLATATVNASSGSGGADVVGAIGTHGGAGGAFTGTEKATAIGFSASASVTQQGGNGGNSDGGIGVTGTAGGGANSALSNQVVGRTYGGTLTLSQTAIGGAGGNSDGGTAGAAGTASSSLGPSTYANASQVTGTLTATGGAGGGIYGVGGATAGVVGGTASVNLNLTGNRVVDLQATATGGAGGSTGNGTGATAAGGAATATSAATSTTTGNDYVLSIAAANGGAGGSNTNTNGTSGSQGGAATQALATVTAPGQGAGGRTVARAEAIGGAGGGSLAGGQQGGAGGEFGGAGGSGSTSASASGYSAYAYVLQNGGTGGGGYSSEGQPTGASGGNGGDSYLLNKATGATHAVDGAKYGGSLTLTQKANGGAGGNSSTAAGGTGGYGTSKLSFNDYANSTQASSLTGNSTASGAASGTSYAGGSGREGIAGIIGGSGTATINLTGATAVTASATAFGGAGGTGSSIGLGGEAIANAVGEAMSKTDAVGTGTAAANAQAIGGGTGAAQGTANATSSAITQAGQQATATSIANGADDLDNTAQASAITYAPSIGTGAYVTSVLASAKATGDGDLTALSTANIDTTNADNWAEPGFNSDHDSVYAYAGVLAPISGLLDGIVSAANPTIDNALGGSNATILGYGTQGAYAEANASGVETLTSSETYTLAGASGELYLGLVSDNSLVGAGGVGAGFDSLTFEATVGGRVASDQVFNPQGMTTTTQGQETLAQFFTDNVLDLGAAASGLVTLSLSLVTSAPGNGFEASMLLGTAPVTSSWAKDVPGNFDDPTKWTGDAVPGASTAASIDYADQPQVLHSSGSDTVQSLTNTAGDLVMAGGSLTADTLENDSTMAWTGGALVLNTSDGGVGTLLNTADAHLTIAATGNGQRLSASGAGTAAVDNAGMITVDGGLGIANIDVALVNTGEGQIDVDHGTFSLNGGGSSDGSGLQGSSGGVLQFGLPDGGPPSTFTITGGEYAVGNTTVNGGTLNLSAASSVFFVDSLRIAGAGTLLLGAMNATAQNGFVQGPDSWDDAVGTPFLSGTGTFTVYGGGVLSSGVESGSGLTRLIGSNQLGAIDLDDGRTVENDGWMTWSSGDITLGAGDASAPVHSGTISNVLGATFYVTANARIGNQGAGTSQLDNAGVTAVFAGIGETDIDAYVNNSGFLQAQSGTLSLNGGGSSAGGNLYVAADAVLQFGPMAGGAPGGVFSVTSGQYTAGDTAITGGALNVSAASGAIFVNQLAIAAGILQLGGLSDGADQGVLAQRGGLLEGSGLFTVYDGASLMGGAQSGAGTTRLYGTNVLGGSFALDGGRTVENDGWMNWSSGNIALGSGDASAVSQTGTITNVAGAVFYVTADGRIGTPGTGGGTLNNTGVLAVFAGVGESDIDAYLNDTGTGSLQVQSGTLGLNGGGTANAGNLYVASNTVVQFGTMAATGTGGTFVFNGGPYTGSTVVDGSTLDLSAVSGVSFGTSLSVSTGTLLLGGNFPSAQTFDQTGGTVSGTGYFYVGGPARLDGGLETGNGRTVLQDGGSIGGAAQFDGGRSLENDATLTWTGGNITLGGGDSTTTDHSATLINTGVLEIETAGTINSAGFPGTGTISNTGTIISGGLGTTSIYVNLFDNGVVDVTAGTLALEQGMGGSGTFLLGAAATLDFVSGAGSDNSMQFLHPGGTLESDSLGKFGPTLSGFAAGDVIDAGGVGYVTGTTMAGFNGGVLTVSTGAQSASFSLAGVYDPNGFQIIGSDGHGGTQVGYS